MRRVTLGVREAAPTDLQQVARLRWTWSEEGQDRIKGSPDDFARDFAAWYEQRDDFIAWVAAEDETVVAMAFLALPSRVPDPRAFQRRTGDIQSVYVLPAYRGQGIGTRLIAALVEHGTRRGCTRITVHSSTRALPVYERSGFTAQPDLLLLPLH